MKVIYKGTLPGYHNVGRFAARLLPGENDVPDELGVQLIKAGLCEPVKPKAKPLPKLGKKQDKDKENIDELERL